MKQNVKVHFRDWKQPLPAKTLMEMIQFVQDACNGRAQVSEDLVERGDDCITTVVWPADIMLNMIKEDTSHAMSMAEAIHVTDAGKLFMLFNAAEFGAVIPDPATLMEEVWFDEEDAHTWCKGIEAHLFLKTEKVDKEEEDRLKQDIDDALALI